MKVVVRLSILVAALLLVNNIAFADSHWIGKTVDKGVHVTASTSCTGDQMFCYAVTATSGSGSVFNETYEFCLNNVGFGCVDLTMFGGGPGWFKCERGSCNCWESQMERIHSLR